MKILRCPSLLVFGVASALMIRRASSAAGTGGLVRFHHLPPAAATRTSNSCIIAKARSTQEDNSDTTTTSHGLASDSNEGDELVTSVAAKWSGLSNVLVRFGRDLLALGGRQQQVDYRDLLDHGVGVGNLVFWGTIFHPTRLIRSTLLGWMVCQVLDRWWWSAGFFFKASGNHHKKKRNKRKPNVKRYRRVKTDMNWKTKKYQGIVPPPPEPEEFRQPQPPITRQQQRGQTAINADETKVFDNIIPESKEMTNLLSNSDKKRTIKGYEITNNTRGRSISTSSSHSSGNPSRGRLHRNKMTQRRKKKKKLRFRLTRKNKSTIAWILGHVLSPFLWLTPIGGWTCLLCAGAELVHWAELDNDNNNVNELMEFIEPFRDDLVKAVLFGSIVGAMMMSL